MSEALRLADELQRVAKWSDSEHWDTLAQAAAELRRLHAENEALKADLIKQGYRQCAKGQKTTQFCGMVEQAVKAEREACIKVCEQLEQEWEDAELWSSFKAVGFVIDAIRSRT